MEASVLLVKLGILEDDVMIVTFLLCLVNKCVVSNLNCTCGETVLATPVSAVPTALVTRASVDNFKVEVR